MIRKLIIIFALLSIPVVALAVQRVSILPLTIGLGNNTTTVTGTATAIPATALVGRESIAIFNVDNSTETVWIGDSNVTSANGFPLTSSNPAISIDVDDSVVIYAISDGTSVDVRTLEAK
jgi:hypothetical protein